MGLDKLIDLDLLTRYNTKKSAREDEKIQNLPIHDRNTLIKEYFKRNSTGKVYGVKFAYDANDVLIPNGYKYSANAGLVIEPSTRDVVGRNDYSGLNLFKHLECNAHVDENGYTVIDYIEGESGFSRTGAVDVVCVFAPVYEKIYEGYEGTTKYFYIEWTDRPKEGYTLNILCKNKDGENNGFYCIAKYQAVLINGIPYSSLGRPWTNGPSHNACITYYHKKGSYVSAMTCAEWAMVQRIFMMKFASTNSQAHLNGLTNYLPTSFYQIQFATTNKEYIILATSSANNLIVNTRIDIGTSTSRNNNNFTIGCNLEILSKSDDIVIFNGVTNNITSTGYNIKSIDTNIMCVKSKTGTDTQDVEGNPITFTYTIDGDETETEYNGTVQLVVSDSTYLLELYDENVNKIGDCSVSGIVNCTILYLDDNVTALTSHRVCTSIYKSGYSSEILGEDGCYMRGEFTTSSRHPAVLSGIEFNTGAYDTIGNSVWWYDNNSDLHLKLINDPSHLSANTTTIINTYTDIGIISRTSTAANWNYGKNIHYDLDNGGFTMNTGGSSTTGLCDGVYMVANTTKNAFYEVLVFGFLYNGAPSGLFCANANSALSDSSWRIASRPSLGGSRV
jgi:hypothetical protein